MHHRQGGIPSYCHTVILPFCRISIPPYCHTVILPYCHSAVFPYRHTAILSFCHIAILPSFHTAILPYCHSAIFPYRHTAILSFCHIAILPYSPTGLTYGPQDRKTLHVFIDDLHLPLHNKTTPPSCHEVRTCNFNYCMYSLTHSLTQTLCSTFVSSSTVAECTILASRTPGQPWKTSPSSQR